MGIFEACEDTWRRGGAGLCTDVEVMPQQIKFINDGESANMPQSPGSSVDRVLFDARRAREALEQITDHAGCTEEDGRDEERPQSVLSTYFDVPGGRQSMQREPSR